MPELYTSAAPVFEVGGQVFGELARDLVRLEIAEATDGLKTMSLRLRAHGPQAGASDQQLLYLDGAILDFGKDIVISIGPPGGARTVFRGVISGIEANFAEAREPEVVVFAEDALMKLRMTRRSRTYENVTDADIARAIAAEHGLAVEADAEGPTYDVVQQFHISDLAFLRERARRIQAELWFEMGTLHFKSRGNRRATELTLVQGNELLEVQIRADLAHQRSKVRVSGYDAQDRDVIEGEAGPEEIRGEAARGRTGPEILDRALGERITHRVMDAPLTDAEAQAWARAEMLDRCRGFVTATGVTNGSPDMIVGSRLTLERVGAPFSGGDYYVTSVRHTYDLESGFRTHFQAERPYIAEGA